MKRNLTKAIQWIWKNQSKLFSLATKVFALTTVAMLLIKWGSGRITTEQVIDFIQAINPFTLITG